STYANGWEVAYTYDNLDRVTEVKASKDGTSYTIGRYIYDKLGRVARFVDGQVSGKSCTYGYDLTDRLCEAVFDDGTAYRYTYDVNDCLVKEVQTTPDGVRTVTRAYDADSRETTVICGSAKIEKTFDKLGRLSSIRRNGGKHTTAYTYETASDGGQTGRIKTVKNGSGTWEYAYDAWGNVSKATENGSADSHTYTYDAQGQLTREYDPDKKLYLGYQYDAGGNLTEVRSYPAGAEGGPEGTGTVLKTFAYGSTWKDQLASVTMEGKTRNFTYDANGNLLSDGKYTYSWTKGSLLEKVTGDGLEAVYTYDASGIRTSKKVNGITTEYLTAGGSVLSEKKNGVWQHYLYDGSGQLTAITGSMAGTLGKDNPYRFKGYYYDEETGMYYLKSRYYQPEICRFISADVYIATELNTNGSNMYSYCKNNPVMLMDSDGSFAILAIAGAFLAEKGTEMLVGAVVNVATTAIVAGILGEEYTLKDAAMAAVTGAVGALGWQAQVGVAVTSGVYNLGAAAIKGEDIDTALATTAISVAGTLGSTGSIASMLKADVSIATSAVIGMTCDFGVNLSSSAATKAVSNSNHTSKKQKKQRISIQAYAIRSAIQIAVRKAIMSRRKTSNRRKRGWIDLRGIQKRRTYN
ncbi:MAG: RHS repeat-associated core domain-containing protein, partial [Coprococcus catus]|nr:RHS repeat-associated core domain-containing protein [Coprococcus catus]